MDDFSHLLLFSTISLMILLINTNILSRVMEKRSSWTFQCLLFALISVAPTALVANTSQTSIKVPNYQIVRKAPRQRYDRGKILYVLIDPINLKSNQFKKEIEMVLREIVSQQGGKISINVYDQKSALNLSYKQYGDMSLGRPLTQREQAKLARHLIAMYAGEQKNLAYLNSLSFFPAAFKSTKNVGKYVGTIEFNASENN